MDAGMQDRLLLKPLPLGHEAIVSFTKERNSIAHPVCMFLNSDVLAVGGYPEVFPEDYALCSLMTVHGYRFENLAQVLPHMRTGEDLIAQRGLEFLRRAASLVRFLRPIDFFTPLEAFKFSLVRAASRLPPPGVRQWLYRHTR
jgi:hypothetical protein